jgi:hypothetical protein
MTTSSKQGNLPTCPNGHNAKLVVLANALLSDGRTWSKIHDHHGYSFVQILSSVLPDIGPVAAMLAKLEAVYVGGGADLVGEDQFMARAVT